MDSSTLTLMPHQREMSWSDDHSMSSGEDSQDAVAPSPSPSQHAWMDAGATARLQAGQLSPMSAGMETAAETLIDGSSAPTMVHSASSSCTDSWSIGFADRDEADNEVHWEQGSDDILTIPKLEPMEDDFNMDDLKAAPLASDPDGANGAQVKQKRPRGRPRKHPLATTVAASKVTKGRSKTGCITCRKRKKKCDEAKPRCMNCEKNAVVCEGYHEKQIWRSGKERAQEERMRLETVPMVTMQPLFHGVETAEDKAFWKHYINHFSNVLTFEGDTNNAFKDIILPLANQDEGLMHSILALSSKHIDYDEPYGKSILLDNPSITEQSLQKRAEYHHDTAMLRLCEPLENLPDKDDIDHKTTLSARYAQMLCLLLQTRAVGNPRGEHRMHLQAYQSLIQSSPPEDSAFQNFIIEFFQYHIYADDLFWHPETQAHRLSSEDWEPPVHIHPSRLLGVADGLFPYLSQITTIRNRIRTNMAIGREPLVDYTDLYQASEINTAITNWTPNYAPGDSRVSVGLLYKQMMWVYLFRTIYPPSSSPSRRTTHPVPTGRPMMPGMPVRRASMAASIGSSASTPMMGSNNPHLGNHMPRSCPPSRNPSRTSSMHEQDTHQRAPAAPFAAGRASSPAPIRRPQQDPRITIAVEESLTLLESFQQQDQAQTLLLIPCMVIGTACFDATQQERVRAAVKTVRAYTGLRNCDRVVEVLDEVWGLMRQGDWVAVWDWQGVARRMGLDFSCT